MSWIVCHNLSGCLLMLLPHVHQQLQSVHLSLSQNSSKPLTATVAMVSVVTVSVVSDVFFHCALSVMENRYTLF